jgi:hypothetical protein
MGTVYVLKRDTPAATRFAHGRVVEWNNIPRGHRITRGWTALVDSHARIVTERIPATFESYLDAKGNIEVRFAQPVIFPQWTEGAVTICAAACGLDGSEDVLFTVALTVPRMLMDGDPPAVLS